MSVTQRWGIGKNLLAHWIRCETLLTYWQTLRKRCFNFSALSLRSMAKRLRSSMSFFRKREHWKTSARRKSSAYFCIEEGTSCASNPCAVLSVIISTKSPQTAANGGTASPWSPRNLSATGNSTRISASGTYACVASMKLLRSSASRIEVRRLWIRLSIFAPRWRIRKGKRSIASATLGLPIREMSSFAAVTSSCVGGPFFARTSWIC